MRSQQGGIKAWLIFILIIIIAFGALYYFRSVLPETGEETAVTEETETPKKKFAVEKISEEKKVLLDNAAMEDALNSGDAGECENITYDETLRQQCLDALNYTDIMNSGDETQCEQFNSEELKIQCLNEIYYSDAMDTLDSSLCKKISDDSLKQRCLDQIQVIMGKDAESEEDCDGISDPALKQECLNGYYYTASVESLDADSCDSITNSELRERCTSTIAQNIEVIEVSEKEAESVPKSTQEILAACDNYSGQEAEDCKDDANYELAYEEKDISYCNRISDTSKQKECIDKQSDSINQFYFRQATAYGSEELCNKITNTSLKALCLDSI